MCDTRDGDIIITIIVTAGIRMKGSSGAGSDALETLDQSR